MTPLPSFKLPFQTALAVRSMTAPFDEEISAQISALISSMRLEHINAAGSASNVHLVRFYVQHIVSRYDGSLHFR